MNKQRRAIVAAMVSALFFGLAAAAAWLTGARWFGFAAVAICAFLALWLCGFALRGLAVRGLCFILLLALALGGVAMARPDPAVSFEGTLARESIRAVMRLPAFQNGGLFDLGSRAGGGPSGWKAPRGFTFVRHELPNCAVELLSRGPGQEKVVYQLHGGGYMIGMTDHYRSRAVRWSGIADGADVATLDYRVAPAYLYPAALEDALAGWDLLLSLGYRPGDILLAGDSAGGNLALALALKLRDSGAGMPAALVLMSPWADLSAKGASRTANIHLDPMFGIPEGEPYPDNALPPVYAGDTDLKDPYLSPVYASFEGFPPLLIQVGSWEILESDSVTVYEKALAAGADARLTRFEGMFHVFQMFGGLLPESRAAWNEIRGFVREVLPDRGE